MIFKFQPMTAGELYEINRWRWADVIFDRPALPNASQAFTARDASGAVVGYCAFGEIPDELSPQQFRAVTAGVSPSLVGCGNGRDFMSAVLRHGRATFPQHVVAGVVKNSNQRSLQSALGAGFVILRSAADGEGVVIVDGLRMAK